MTISFLNKLQAMAATLDLDEVVTQTLELIETIGAAKAMVLLLDDRQHALQFRAGRGLESDPALMRRWLQAHGGSAAILEQLRQEAAEVPAAIMDLSAETELCAQEGHEQFACIALRTHGQFHGALLFAPIDINNTQTPVNTPVTIAGFAAGAIHNAMQYGQARLQSITDPLTGLYNKRYFKQALPYEIARALRYGKPMTLMMIDIDHFKQLNDVHGHPKGDQVLAAVGGTLNEALRSTDFSFRYGGEEFAVILPETRLENAFQVAEHLRCSLQERLSRQLNPAGHEAVTASVGLAAFPHDGNTGEVLLKHADRCLYKAKEQGRNRVFWEINTHEART